MQNRYALLLASFLYKYSFPLYKRLYYSFKKRQDREEIQLLSRHTRPGNILLDIGSNIGFYAEILSRLTGPEGEVHCFEPDRNNFRHLKTNTKDLRNIILHEYAVSATNGKITLYVSDMLNVDHRTYPPESFKDSYEVPTVCIDEYVQGAYKVDIIKMDIQGAELAALKGMKQTIRANPDIKLLMEFWPYGFLKSGSSSLEVFRFLHQELGLNVYSISKNSLEKITEEKVKEMKNGFFDNYNILVTNTRNP